MTCRVAHDYPDVTSRNYIVRGCRSLLVAILLAGALARSASGEVVLLLSDSDEKTGVVGVAEYNQSLYVATESGLFKKDSYSLTEVPLKDYRLNASPFSMGKILDVEASVDVDGKEFIWLSFEHQVYRYPGLKSEPTLGEGNFDIQRIGDGTWFISSETIKVWRDGRVVWAWSVEDHAESSIEKLRLSLDETQIWLGGKGWAGRLYGGDLSQPGALRFHLFPWVEEGEYALGSLAVGDIFEAQGEVFLTTFSTAETKVPGPLFVIQELPDCGFAVADALGGQDDEDPLGVIVLADLNDGIWAGTTSGIYRFVKHGKAWSLVNSIDSVAEAINVIEEIKHPGSGETAVWILGSENVYKNFRQPALHLQGFKGIFSYRDSIWIWGDKGLARFDDRVVMDARPQYEETPVGAMLSVFNVFLVREPEVRLDFTYWDKKKGVEGFDGRIDGKFRYNLARGNMKSDVLGDALVPEYCSSRVVNSKIPSISCWHLTVRDQFENQVRSAMTFFYVPSGSDWTWIVNLLAISALTVVVAFVTLFSAPWAPLMMALVNSPLRRLASVISITIIPLVISFNAVKRYLLNRHARRLSVLLERFSSRQVFLKISLNKRKYTHIEGPPRQIQEKFSALARCLALERKLYPLSTVVNFFGAVDADAGEAFGRDTLGDLWMRWIFLRSVPMYLRLETHHEDIEAAFKRQLAEVGGMSDSVLLDDFFNRVGFIFVIDASGRDNDAWQDLEAFIDNYCANNYFIVGSSFRRPYLRGFEKFNIDDALE